MSGSYRTRHYRYRVLFCTLWLGCLAGCQPKGEQVDETPGYDLTIQKTLLTDTNRQKGTLVENRKVVDRFSNGRVFKDYLADIYSDGSKVPNGAYVEYHENGKVAKKGRYSNGKHIGEWVFNHPNGQLAKKGIYVDDKDEGEWPVYDERGSKLRIELYLNGKPHGDWKYFNENEETISVKGFRDGKLNGDSIRFYENGRPNVVTRFKDGKLHGLTEKYYESGKRLSLEEYEFGKRHGLSVSWLETGQIVNEVEFNRGIRVPFEKRTKTVDKPVDENVSDLPEKKSGQPAKATASPG